MEVDVLALSESGFSTIGLAVPESGTRLPADLGIFAIPLSDEEAGSLIEHSSTERLHHLTVGVTSDNPTQFNVDSRVPGGANVPAQTYFQAGLNFQVESHASMDRNITITTISSLRIRRGPGESGAPAPVLFETQPQVNQIQVPDGKTILVGGFAGVRDASRLQDLPADLENPILSFILAREPVGGRNPEIVLILKPQVVSVETVPLRTPVPTLTSNDESVSPPLTLNVPVAPAIASLIVPKEPMFRLPPPPAPPPPASFYAVQVGAFGVRANAETLAEKLKQEFEDVYIVPTSTGQALYRVRVGRLEDFDAADHLQARLRTLGFTVFMVYPETK